MASLYRRARSPFFWISYLDIAGNRRQESTKFRYDVTSEARKAHELCRELSTSESEGLDRGELWEAWLPSYFENRYANSPKTLLSFRGAWRNLKAFLDSRAIHLPRQLTRQHVREYVTSWRKERHTDMGVHKATKNTALNEIKFLRIAMFEAVQNGFARVNPCEKLGIPLDPSPRKPRITEEEYAKIVAALGCEPSWMQVSFAIAWHQGCRFSETCLPLSAVDLDRMVIGLKTKGKKGAQVAEFPLSPKLVPMFRSMKSEGREMTFNMPQGASKTWWLFFRRIGLPHICFHACRVTFVTRCYEAGIPREAVMRLVGHSTYAAHSIYPRVEASHSTVQAMRRLL